MKMNKLLTGFGLIAALGLVACGSDSSSGSSEPSGDPSSSSAAVVEIPDAVSDSLILIDNFKEAWTTATKLKFAGSIGVNFDLQDTSVAFDSVSFKLGDASRHEVAANFTMKSVDFGTKQQISIGNELTPELDLESIDTCGTFTVYMIVYAHSEKVGNIVAIDSVPNITKKCVEIESSSSAAEIELSAWDVTLSTNAVERPAVDLDAKATFLNSEIEANAAAIDLYLTRESRKAVLKTNASLDVAAPSKIAKETKSLADAKSYPSPAYVSSFRYAESDLTDSVVEDDLYDHTAYVVISPSYDAATGKGFYIVLIDNLITAGNNYTLKLVVLGNWE